MQRTSILAANFSSENIATTDTPCQGSRCTNVIPAGQKGRYIPNANPTKPGRYCCSTCFNRYSSAPDTIRVPRTVSNPDLRAANIDTRQISQSINVAQRQGAHTPAGRVTALPSGLITGSLSSGPIIANPSFVPTSFPFPAPSASFGYTENHKRHAQEQRSWQEASKAPLKHIVPILVDVYYESKDPDSEDVTEEPTAISEGSRVDHFISPQSLVVEMFRTVLPELQALRPGFAWDTSEMVFRESVGRHNIQRVSRLQYFDGRFNKEYSAGKKATTVRFVAPKQSVRFSVIILHAQWVRSQLYFDSRVAQKLSSDVALVGGFKRKTPPSPEKKAEPISLPKKTRPVVSDIESVSYIRASSTSSFTAQNASSILVPSLSDSGTPQPTPPTLINTNSEFMMIDSKQIQAGMSAVGGQASILRQRKKLDDQVVEAILGYTVLRVPFAELCGSSAKAEALVVDSTSHHGFITYARDAQFLGKGSFKTSIAASLTWQDAPNHGLVSSNPANPRQPIAVALKRPYSDKRQGADGGVKRFSLDDESKSIHTEAVMLGWAQSLMDYAYHFIGKVQAQRLPEKPPLPIPRLRFVHAALAYAQKSLDSSGAGSSRPQTSHRAVYLLEELLVLPHPKDFVKYIYNGSADPLLEDTHPAFGIATFLSFMQHAQYFLTGGVVFLSDFQGYGNLLTDPQVMTKPNSDGKALFGGGNVASAFNSFATEHQCNEYCTWFGLEKLQ